MSKSSRVFTICLAIIWVLFIGFVGLRFVDWFYQYSAYLRVNDMFVTAIASGEDYADLKELRSYQMGVSTRAGTKLKVDTLYALIILSAATANYVIVRKHTPKELPVPKKYQHGQYPFNTMPDEEKEESEVQ